MPETLLMPSLSPDMVEATLARWLKAEGDAVKAGEAIAEIETDKATMELEAPAAGVLGKLLVAAGTLVKVQAPIALLLRDGEQAAAAAARPAAPAPASTPVAAPPAAAALLAAPPPPAPPLAGPRRIFASPIARRLAREAGLDLAAVTGSGPGGRIVKEDVERARAAAALPAPGPVATAAHAPAPPPAFRPMPWQKTTAVPNGPVRKVIARRLLEAKQAIPHYYLTADVELDALLALRASLNVLPAAGYKLSVNDFAVKAVALALRRVPAANAMWTDEAVLRFDTVDVAVAVAAPSGLVTPVVRDADRKGLVPLSNELRELTERARAGRLRPEEYQGGSFTVSNLGMHGIREFAAIINPPQSGILAVGAAEQRPVVRDGAVAIRTLMTCTLSADHRTVDGAVGAELLSAFRAIVQDPLQLLI